MPIHHHIYHIHKHLKRHWSTKKGRISIIAIIGVSVAIVYTLVSFLFTLNSQVSAVQPMSETTLASAHLHKLAKDEYALIATKVGGPSGKKAMRVFRLANGQTVETESDQATQYTLLDGDTSSTSYITLSDNVEVHKKNTQNSTLTPTPIAVPKKNGKVDQRVNDNLKTNQVTDVLIKFNVPYGKYYEKGDNANTRSQKQQSFEKVKGNVASSFTSKSHVNRDLKIINGVAATIDSDTLAKLANSPDIASIEPDIAAHVTLDTSVAQIHANTASSFVDTTGNSISGKGETIAIIDTGVDYLHPDLGGCLGPNCKVIGGYDFVNNDADPMDDMGHGTHVADIAAGNGSPVSVAPGAKILAYKVCNANGSCPSSYIIQALSYAVDPNQDGNTADHVNVVSMSLGGGGNPDDAMSLAVDNASSVGVVSVIAAGNSGPSLNTINSPGTARSAITVGAACKLNYNHTSVSCSNNIASFSSRGPLVWNGVDLQKPDVVAPGEEICAARWGTAFAGYSTCFDSAHVRLSGTSMATPHVAGSVALILQAHPDFTSDQVKQLLRSSADSLGATTNDQGAGQIDVVNALPHTSVVSSTPSGWSITSDPTTKTTSSIQQFSVTTSNPSLASVSAAFVGNPAGITGTLTQNMLQLSTGSSASLGATVTIDNDSAKPGLYTLQIVFSSGGVVYGNIPVFVTVNPTFTVSPTTGVDYGVDNPGLSSWTSNAQMLTVTNLRKDASTTIALSSTGFSTGVTLQSPASVTVAAGGSATVNTNLLVDNTKVANGIYNGSILFNGGQPLGAKFTKFYVLTVVDSNPTDLTKAQPVMVYSSNGTEYTDFTSNSPRVFYLNDPGTYDVIVKYVNVVTNQYQYPLVHEVFKEGVSVSGVSTTVTTSVNDATNLVRIAPTDSNGNATQLFASQDKLSYVGNTGWVIYNFATGGQQPQITDEYFSNVSSHYQWSRLATSIQPANPIYYYFAGFTGLSGSKTFSNAAGDFKVVNVQYNLDQQSGSTPYYNLIFGGLGGANGSAYNTTLPTLSVPYTQTVYSLVPSTIGDFYGAAWTTNSYVYQNELTAMFNPDTNQRWNLGRYVTYPNRSESTLYLGLGPTVWFGSFHNSPNYIDLRTYYGNYSLGSNNTPLLRQDFANKPYNAIPFTITQGSTQVSTGSLPQFPFGGNLSPVYVASPGVYQFNTTIPYKAAGKDMTGKVTASFNTNNTDPNPPAFKRLYYYANYTRAEVYDPSVENKAEFELDPVGGTLSNVTVGFSADGTTFQNVTVSSNNGVYTAILPQVSTSIATIRITAIDNANNSLSYTFQVPQGTAPVSTITPTPSPVIPTATPTPVPSATPTPTPTPIADLTGPVVTFTNPLNNAQVAKNTTTTITATATDPSGVAKVEFYVNNKLLCSDTQSPYTCTWKVPSQKGAKYQLQAKGYDTLGNTSTTTISVTSK